MCKLLGVSENTRCQRVGRKEQKQSFQVLSRVNIPVSQVASLVVSFITQFCKVLHLSSSSILPNYYSNRKTETSIMSASPTILMMNSLSLEDPKIDYHYEEQTSKRMQSISSDHTPTSSAIHYKDYVQSLGDEDSSQHDEMNDDSNKGSFEDDEGSCSSDSIVVLENLRLVSNDKRRSRLSIKNRDKQLNKDEADDCFSPLDYEDSDEEKTHLSCLSRGRVWSMGQRVRNVSRLYE
jgi:hypothetical protein